MAQRGILRAALGAFPRVSRVVAGGSSVPRHFGWQPCFGAAAAHPLGVRLLSGLPSASASIKSKVDPKDIISLAEYEQVRKGLVQAHRTPLKKLRRVALGPSASVLFTNYDLIWFQIQEMLRIEKGGDEQLAEEIEAYKDLVPKGGEICACLMFELGNEVARRRFLEAMVGSEHQVSLSFGGEMVKAAPIHDDIDRTHPEGRTSAVHFIKWKLTPEQQAKFKGEVVLKMGHEHYPHMTQLTGDLVAAVHADLSIA